MSDLPVSILFICLGNICRSPLAEGVMRHHVAEAGLTSSFLLDSAGTGAWHVGNPPDRRSVGVGTSHGVDLSDLRARKIHRDDFYSFDLILAMDRNNLADLRAMQPQDGHAEIELYLGYCGQGYREVPDPYYGGADGFEAVYQMINKASTALLDRYRAFL